MHTLTATRLFLNPQSRRKLHLWSLLQLLYLPWHECRGRLPPRIHYMTTTTVIILLPLLYFLPPDIPRDGLHQHEESINLVLCDKPLHIMMSRQDMDIQIVVGHTTTLIQVDRMILDIAEVETIMTTTTHIIITRTHEVVMVAAEEGDLMFE